MRKLIQLTCIALILGATALTAQKTSIQLKLKKGDVYTQQTEMNNTMNQQMMGQSINMDQKMTMIHNLTVVDVLNTGNFVVEQAYVQVKMDMDMNGQKTTFDTENTENTNPALAPLNKMKEAKIRFEVSPNGTISNITGLSEMMNSISSNNPQVGGMIKNMANESTLAAAFSYLPKEKVAKGDSYTNSIKLNEMFDMEIASKYTVSAINGNVVNLNLASDISFAPEEPITQNGMKMDIKATGNQNGTFEINKKDGMATSSSIKQLMDMTMSMKNPQNGEDINIPMKLNSTISTTITKN
ncbi:DUF6263 family protein [Labilibacter marinus]|uniref:DUF6263 family protein n=1 Tax=Labilibacter marinus TaxID=1477105 RepID=UPI000829B027|nr:DUF6263 family protein [Labilibacter marinus]